MKLGEANNSKREEYEAYYKQIPEKILINYHNKYKISMRKNVILRVALDDYTGQRWDTKIDRPAYKNLSVESLRFVVYNFQKLMKPKVLLEKIKQSNSYRVDNKIPDKLIEALEDIKE